MTSAAPNDHRPTLAAQPDIALGYVLGLLAARPLRAADCGRLAALCTELRRRGLYDALIAALDTELAGQLRMLETADRGQHFAAFGAPRLV